MKLVWKNKKQGGQEGDRKRLRSNPDLPFAPEAGGGGGLRAPPRADDAADWAGLAETLQSQGNDLAEKGMYREALAKWDAALRAAPRNAVLLEQKAQVLLEIGDAWGAVNAATRATKVDPSWAEAWITLARGQLNYGEPDAAIISFDKALELKPDAEDVKIDRETAVQLVYKRDQVRSSGASVGEGRFVVVDEIEQH